MRLIAAVLSLAMLAGCACGPTSEPVMEIKSPIWFRSQPTLTPQGYAIAAPAQTVYAPVPQIQAPAYQYAPVQQPRAVGPCGGGMVPFSPPPVPGDDVPESIPAIRR